jgi:CheY-like chemotaxis protein
MKNQTRILLIDDDEDDRWLFLEALSRIAPEIQCDTAADGQQAIDILTSENCILPEKIFLDLNLPGMDGKKCLAAIKSIPKLEHIPVVVYSTSKFHKDIEETRKLGASRFIVKPSNYSQLCDLFSQMFCPEVNSQTSRNSDSDRHGRRQ